MSEPQNAGLTAKQNRSLMMVLPLVLLIGLGLAVWGGYLARFQVDLLIRGETATGRVVALERASSSSASGRFAMFPIVEFRTAGGDSVRFRHRTGSHPLAYGVGESVAVNYLPASPADALIAEGFRNWLLPVLLLIVGPGLMFLALFGIGRLRKRSHTRSGRTAAGASQTSQS